MSQYYQQSVEKLNKFLHENNKVAPLFEKLEKSTKVQRIYLAQAFIGLAAIYMIIGHFAALICNLLGFLWPAWKSLAALETSSKEDDTKWLTYWVVFAAFSVVEFFSDFLFNWFPFYWLGKVIFLIWCYIDIPNNGSKVIYTRILRPLFLQRRQQIHDTISGLTSTASKAAASVSSASAQLSNKKD